MLVRSLLHALNCDSAVGVFRCSRMRPWGVGALAVHVLVMLPLLLLRLMVSLVVQRLLLQFRLVLMRLLLLLALVPRMAVSEALGARAVHSSALVPCDGVDVRDQSAESLQ